MHARRVLAAVLVVSLLGGFGIAPRAASQPAAVPPPGPGGDEPREPDSDVTPARLSFIDGPVSFWRPGAEDWGPARLNTPLAPGDTLFAGQGGNLEVQVGARAFVRATDETHIGLDSQEPDYLQFRVTGGHASLDLRELPAGWTIEVDTPNAAITVERPGYYHVDVDQDTTALGVHRGGVATVTPAGGAAVIVESNQQAVTRAGDQGATAIGPAPALTEWDSWNYKRTGYLIQHADTRYVPPATYGTEELSRHGTWRTVETYGSVWVPSGVPSGWVPYSDGRWIWDPRFGWTWLDDAPWGWAPYHYGRWVFVRNYWAWAPGPIVVRPVYAPALVVFLGGATISVGRPVCWAPLGWGEPVIPWWGRRGFVGVPWWGGWGGPRVVNNVVINRQKIVNVTTINVYRHVHVTHAVVGVSRDRFGRAGASVSRVRADEVRQLRPVHGALDVQPVATSVLPAVGPAVKPPAAMQSRSVVATRPRQDMAPALRRQGLDVSAPSAPSGGERLVPAPRATQGRNGGGQPLPGDPGRLPGATTPVPVPGSRQSPPQRSVGTPRETPPPMPGGTRGAPRDSGTGDTAGSGIRQGPAQPSPRMPSPSERTVPVAPGPRGGLQRPESTSPANPPRPAVPGPQDRRVAPDRSMAPTRPSVTPPDAPAPPRTTAPPPRALPERRTVAPPPVQTPAPPKATVPPSQTTPGKRGTPDGPAAAPPNIQTSPRGAVPAPPSPDKGGAGDRPAVAPPAQGPAGPRSAVPSQDRRSLAPREGRPSALAWPASRPQASRPTPARHADSAVDLAPRRPQPSATQAGHPPSAEPPTRAAQPRALERPEPPARMERQERGERR
jgi:hypothetical protein